MLQFVKGDIQSGDLLRYVMDTEKIDTVMHFAAQVCCQASAEMTHAGRLACLLFYQGKDHATGGCC